MSGSPINLSIITIRTAVAGPLHLRFHEGRCGCLPRSDSEQTLNTRIRHLIHRQDTRTHLCRIHYRPIYIHRKCCRRRVRLSYLPQRIPRVLGGCVQRKGPQPTEGVLYTTNTPDYPVTRTISDRSTVHYSKALSSSAPYILASSGDTAGGWPVRIARSTSANREGAFYSTKTLDCPAFGITKDRSM